MAHSYINGVSQISTIFFHTPGNKLPSFFYYPLCTGHYFCNIPYEVNRTCYDSFLLLYTKSGKGLFTINGMQQILSAGDVCLIDCYKPHDYQALGEWDFLWLHFDGGLARDFFEYLTMDNPFYFTTLKNPLTFESSIHALQELFIKHKPLSEPLLSQYITLLLTELAIAKDDNYCKTTPDFIDDTLRYIHRHLETELSLEKLASRISLSPFYFSRKFKEEIGYSPYQYILISRINLAKFYLKSSSDSIKSIGNRCGFKSEHSFCTAFKKETGLTPSEFRNT